MTLKEAKEILDKEGCFIITKIDGAIDYNSFQPWEKAKVKEAIALLGKNGYRIQTDLYKAGERNTRLIEEYEKSKKIVREGDQCLVGSSMSLEEAKDILKKEGWCSFQTLSYRPKGLPKDDWEKPEVYEALKVCWDNHIMPLIKKETFDERKERLESGFYTGKTTQTKIGGMKDHEKVAQIVDKLIEEEGEPVNGEHLNTALHESAKEFNDALLDEQAKKIKELEKDLKFYKEQDVAKSRKIVALEVKLSRNSDDVIQGLKNDHISTIMSILKTYGITVERVYGQEIVGEDIYIPFECPEFITKAIRAASKLGYQVSYSQDGIFELGKDAEKEKRNKKLNDIIASRNAEICELQEKVKKVKEMGKQIAHLNEVIRKKNAQIKDYKIACEEHDEQLKDYMLSDKNKSDMISGLKKLNEKYRHQLADITISKVNEQALKSAESALIYKDDVINKQKKELKKRRMYILQLEERLHEASTILAAPSKSSRCGFVADVIDRQKEVNRLYNKLYDSIKKMNAKNNAYTGVDLGSEEGDKSGYAIGVCVQQKRLAGYVAELMDEIPEWINFYSKWKKAENSINDMSPEEFDKLFNKMFQNKFVW